MTKLLTALALVLAFSAPAYAADWKNTDAHVDANAKTDAYLHANDTNGDGFVDKNENKDWGANDFVKADTDADGKLSPQEIKAHAAKGANAAQNNL